MIFGPMFKTLEVIFELLIPSKIFIDGLIIIGFVILGFCSTIVCQYFASIASQGFGTDLRNRLFKKINELSMKEINFFGIGYLSNIFNNDINRLQLAVAMMVRLVVRAPALVIGSIVCSFLINYKIAFIFLAVVIIVSIFLYIVFSITSKQFLNLQKKNDKLSQIVDDGISGTRVIRSFNTEEYEIKKYKTETGEYYKDSKKMISINALINPITFLVINLAILITVYLGINMLNNGSFINFNGELFSSGDIIALIQYLNQMLMALIVVCNLVVIFNKSFASKKRVDALLIKESSIKNNYNYDLININNGDNLFEFKNVDFSYSGKNNVLNNLNFVIKKGDSIGIIGGTGSGKSTIIKLMDRFFDATNGEILYKGVDIKKYNSESLHKEISIVNQKNQLFKGTIKSNLLIGNSAANENDMITSLKNAEAYSFVEKYPEFLDHYVEEGGQNFSGGQKQRLCIARALIRNSETVIFDDSMSALDFITDKKVRHNLAKMENLTKIYVSQRVTTLMYCDKILVVDNGKIIDIGNHEELLKNCKIYREIYKSQTRSH